MERRICTQKRPWLLLGFSESSGTPTWPTAARLLGAVPALLQDQNPRWQRLCPSLLELAFGDERRTALCWYRTGSWSGRAEYPALYQQLAVVGSRGVLAGARRTESHAGPDHGRCVVGGRECRREGEW